MSRRYTRPHLVDVRDFKSKKEYYISRSLFCIHVTESSQRLCGPRTFFTITVIVGSRKCIFSFMFEFMSGALP